jgi:hypothetical protein
LNENGTGYNELEYQSESFEGYYQWMPRTLAYAETDWSIAEPWNSPTSQILGPGESLTVGLRFSLVDEIKNIEATVRTLGLPVVKGLPGYIIPQDLQASLLVDSNSTIANISTSPPGAFDIQQSATGLTLNPTTGTWGRVRLQIVYENNMVQTVHYSITKSAPDAVHDLGTYLNDKHWWSHGPDRFDRRPSFMAGINQRHVLQMELANGDIVSSILDSSRANNRRKTNLVEFWTSSCLKRRCI